MSVLTSRRHLEAAGKISDLHLRDPPLGHHVERTTHTRDDPVAAACAEIPKCFKARWLHKHADKDLYICRFDSSDAYYILVPCGAFATQLYTLHFMSKVLHSISTLRLDPITV